MIDIEHEELLSLSRAARIVNPSRPPHLATVHRWVGSGVANGVKLESIKIGGTRYTSKQAIGRFIGRLNAPGSVPEAPSAAAQRAGERLAAKGA